MLSILIPIYNHDSSKLIDKLIELCKKEKIAYQILLFDDASKDKWKIIHKKYDELFGISYVELSENIGRSRIRNKLGFNAMHDNLLFLDCDSKLISQKFIKNYLPHLNKNKVIYGGRRYKKKAPKAASKKLHWLYGSKKEALPVKQRAKKPYLRFQTNNFLIPREIFLDIKFNEDLTQYGHEDTLFAQDLKAKNIPIQHIDNPIEHSGLEKNTVFLKKNIKAIENLVQLKKNEVQIETSLTKTYKFLKDYDLLKLFNWIYKKREKSIEQNLLSPKPSLSKLNWYKLYSYTKLIEN